MTEHPVPDGETSGPPTSSAAGTGTRLDRWLGSYAERTHGMRSSEIRALFAVANRPEVVSLAGGMPFLEGLPLDILGELAQRVVATRGLQALQYGSGQGDETLREQILEVMALEGIDAHPDDVVVTTGSQQALDLVTRIFIDPGDVVVAEAPSLRRRARRVPGVPGRRRARPDRRRRPDPGRARVDPRRARRARDAGSSSSTPCPTSTTPPASPCPSSAARRSSRSRAATACWCSRTTRTACSASTASPSPRCAPSTTRASSTSGRSPRRSRPATASAGSSRRTPSARSSSSPASPRSCARRTPRRSPSRPTCPPATGAVRSSRYREQYRERRDAMISALAEHLPEASWNVPDGGFYTWVRLPDGLDAKDMLPRAVTARVAYVPGHRLLLRRLRRRPHAAVLLLPDARAHP